MEPQISGLKMMIFMVVIFQITHSEDTEKEKKCKEEVICTEEDELTNMQRCADSELTYKVEELLFQVFSDYAGEQYKENDRVHFGNNVVPKICKDEFGGSKALDQFWERVDSNEDGLNDKDTEYYEDFKVCVEEYIDSCVGK